VFPVAAVFVHCEACLYAQLLLEDRGCIFKRRDLASFVQSNSSPIVGSVKRVQLRTDCGLSFFPKIDRAFSVLSGSRRMWGAIWCLLVPAFFAAVPVWGASNRLTADEPHYLLMTESLVSDRDLNLADEITERDYAPYHYDTLYRQDEPRPDGKRYTPHSPGLSVLLIPGYVLAEWVKPSAGWVGARIELALLAATILTGAGLLAQRFVSRPVWAAPAAALAVAFSAPLWIYSTQVYPELPAGGILLLLAFLWTSDYDERRPVVAAAYIGLAILVLSWFGAKYLPLCLAIGLIALWRQRHNLPAIFVLCAVTAVGAAHEIWLFLDMYGGVTPYSVNRLYYDDSTVAVVSDNAGGWQRTYRLYGLLFDRRFGLARYAPLWLAAPPALALLWERRETRAKWWPLAVLVLVQWGTATWLALTMRGYWFPGRQVVAVLPLFLPALALVFAVLPRLALALAFYGTLVGVSLVVALDTEQIGAARDPFLLPITPFLRISGIYPSYRFFTPVTYLLTACWLTLLFFVWWVLRRHVFSKTIELGLSSRFFREKQWELQ